MLHDTLMPRFDIDLWNFEIKEIGCSGIEARVMRVNCVGYKGLGGDSESKQVGGYAFNCVKLVRYFANICNYSYAMAERRILLYLYSG